MNKDKISKENNVNKKKKKKKKRIGLKIFIAVLIILALLAGTLAYKAYKLGGGLEGFLAASMGHNENTKKNLDTITFLLLGKSQNLTDTIIVCSYNPKNQTASMLSIPRDTFIGKNKNKATASDKINSLYQISIDKTIKAVNEVTGLDIKYYAVIDTESLRKVVDAVGGIYYDVPRDMDYEDPSQKLYIHLKAGYQLLDGDKAEQLLRYRHGNKLSDTYSDEWGEQDLGRMRTQREFLTVAAKQILQFKNIFKLGQFIEIVHKYVETNIPLELVKDYVPYAIEFDSENIQSNVLPGTSEKCNGVWIYTIDKKASQSIVSELFPDSISSNSQSKNTNIELLNGSGNKEILTKVSKLLKENGYTIKKSDSTSSTSKTTIINRTGKSEDEANSLKNILSIGNLTTGNKSENDIDFTIIIGKDFE